MSEAEWIVFLQRPEIPAFNRAMLDNPDDDLPRLVFADWMDENCPDTAVNAAVRESVANEDRCAAWPGLQENPAWKLTFLRSRVVMRVNWVDRHPAPPAHRRPRNLLEAVWRSGWVEVAEFGRGQHNSLSGWFNKSVMRGVTTLAVSGTLLYPVHLKSLLASCELSRVTALILDGWGAGSELVRVLGESPLLNRLHAFALERTPLDLASVGTLLQNRFLTGLQALSLESCLIGDGGAAAVAYSPHLMNLKHLNLKHNGITDVGAADLADSPYLCNAIRAQWRR